MLAAASLACSTGGDAGGVVEMGQDAAAGVAEVATLVSDGVAATERTADAADAGSDQLALDGEALEELRSYRTLLRAAWLPKEGEPEVVTFEQEQTRDPSARRMVIGGTADDLSVEIVQIGERSWMCSGGACGQIAVDPDQLVSSFSDVPMIKLDEVADGAVASLVGRERIRGIDTRHYVLDITPVQTAFLAQGDVSDLMGEAWIADEADLPAFVVRFEVSWVEKRQEVSGQASFVFETYDVNAPFAIEGPADAEGSGLPDDVPVYPNAEEDLSAPGVVRFRSADTLVKVADAYRVGLAVEGWTLERDDELDTMVNQVWTKPGRTLTLVASTDGGGTTVIIAVEGDG